MIGRLIFRINLYCLARTTKHTELAADRLDEGRLPMAICHAIMSTGWSLPVRITCAFIQGWRYHGKGT